MNRRIILLALAVSVPIALFIPAKIAASWRPVKVAVIEPPNPNGSHLFGPTISFRVHASAREITFSTINNDETKSMLFDFETQKVRALKSEGIVAGGNGLWRLEKGKAPRLVVRQSAMSERSYPLPAADANEINAMPADLYRESANVAANDTRVEMAVGAHYYRWNTRSRVLERNTNCDMEDSLENQAITRDGASLVNAGLSKISALSTQTGEFTRHNKVPVTGAEGAHISEFGSYALYEPPLSDAMTFHVIETANARELWQFKTDSMDAPIVASPDEKYLAIGRNNSQVWEIHDAKTGEIVRTLPMVEAVNSGAFSPDGATLYSVVGGVLYHQRAR